MTKLSVIIPAAGSGVRMGSPVPKPFIELGGKSILYHTLKRFLVCEQLVEVLISCQAEYMPQVKEIFKDLNHSSVEFKIVEGGSERQYSIYNALQQVDERVDLVAVHDAVRPFVKKEQIEECCSVATKYGGAVLGVPAKDTIKKVDRHNIIQETPDRSFLWQAQTPQVFQKELLLKAYENAIKEKLVGTDDSSLVERIGGEVVMVEGDRENLKITYPIDLEVAELILESRDDTL